MAARCATPVGHIGQITPASRPSNEKAKPGLNAAPQQHRAKGYPHNAPVTAKQKHVASSPPRCREPKNRDKQEKSSGPICRAEEELVVETDNQSQNCEDREQDHEQVHTHKSPRVGDENEQQSQRQRALGDQLPDRGGDGQQRGGASEGQHVHEQSSPDRLDQPRHSGTLAGPLPPLRCGQYRASDASTHRELLTSAARTATTTLPERGDITGWTLGNLSAARGRCRRHVKTDPRRAPRGHQLRAVDTVIGDRAPRCSYVKARRQAAAGRPAAASRWSARSAWKTVSDRRRRGGGRRQCGPCRGCVGVAGTAVRGLHRGPG